MYFFFLSKAAHDFTRRRVYGFPRLTNRHRSAFPSAFFADPPWHGWSHCFAFSPRELFGAHLVVVVVVVARKRGRERERVFSVRSVLLTRVRARSLQFYVGCEAHSVKERERGGRVEEREGKRCLSQRGGSFMGDYGTLRRAQRRGWRGDFIPTLSEGNKCRGTFDQPTFHAAPRRVCSPTR